MYCPLTYEPLTNSTNQYNLKGLQLLSKNLTTLKDFLSTPPLPLQQAQIVMAKLSIQAAQPLFYATLNISEQTFELSEDRSTFIIKPPNILWPHLPENEDLTMRLAKLIGLDTPLHGLVYNTDGSLSFWQRRLDRPSLKSPTSLKLAIEDFAQLSGATRNTKKDGSLETVANLIDRFASFPLVEKEKLLRLVIFNFLVGNHEMNLKNLALVTQHNLIKLSPVYNLINTQIVLGETAKEEIGLFLNNKKNDLQKYDFFDYFALQCLGLPPLRIKKVFKEILSGTKKWSGLIAISFLPDSAKIDYITLVNQRLKRLLS